MANQGDEPVDLCLDEAEPDEENTNQQPLSQGETSESNSTCLICMEEWTIGSAHRVCCLKCGHLFGRSCIERWIKEKGQTAKCPNCNKPARRIDLRDLWCKTIRAYDSTELAELQKQLELERKHCAKERSINFHLKNVNDQLYADIEKLKKNIIEKDERLAKLENLFSRASKMRSEQLALDELNNIEPENMIFEINQQPQELKGRFFAAKNVESDPRGYCKSMTLCPTSAEILIAQPLPQGHPRLGNDYGIRKYSLLDTSVHSFIYLHSQPLTSVQVKPFGDLILTSGQDKKVHLTSINNSRKVQTFDCHNEPSSVSWSVHRDQQFYVASKNCYIALYDMRNTSDCIYQKRERFAKTGLVSMTSVCQNDGLFGVVANDARGSQFLELSESSDYESEAIDLDVEHLKVYQLPFSGLMGTVDHYKPTCATLITTRRSTTDQTTTHSLIKLKKRVDIDDGTVRIDCENIRTFRGGRSPDLLSQSRILRHPTLDDQVLVGSCDESARGIKLWDASDNTEYQQLRTNEFVRDMVLYTPENTNQHILYTLHNKGFGVYRWDYA